MTMPTGGAVSITPCHYRKFDPSDKPVGIEYFAAR